MSSGITKGDMQPFITEYCLQSDFFLKNQVSLKQHVLTGLKDAGFGDVTLSDEILSTLDAGEEQLRQAICKSNRDEAVALSKRILASDIA